MKDKLEAPKKIYLQWDGDLHSDDNTWCEDRIRDDDVVYTRSDMVWIPVGERLPEDEGEYLVWFNTNEQGVCEYHKDYPKNNSFFNITPVTHWMPLPDAPEEEKE